jgi:hypothetical protein
VVGELRLRHGPGGWSSAGPPIREPPRHVGVCWRDPRAEASLCCTLLWLPSVKRPARWWWLRQGLNVIQSQRPRRPPKRVKYEFMLELYFSYRSGQNVIINVSPQEMRQNKELNHTQVRKRYVSVNTVISFLLRGEAGTFYYYLKKCVPQ